jgi:hypothetical protein
MGTRIGFAADRCFPVKFPISWRKWGLNYEDPGNGGDPEAVDLEAMEAKRQSLGVKTIKTCRMCFEPGAIRRPCCKAMYCDHCYVKNGRCPNCQSQTKKEALTGATFQLKVFSEHEECRQVILSFCQWNLP